jgi:alpha-aminoadipate/glutamate carrier protein LysW
LTLKNPGVNNLNRFILRTIWSEVNVSYCPECEAEIPEEFEDIGEIIACPECGVELEVISLDPVEFDLAPVDDEDEDDEEDFHFDDADEEEDDWDDDDSFEDDEEENSDEEY